jgi:hypothetical protein
MLVSAWLFNNATTKIRETDRERRETVVDGDVDGSMVATTTTAIVAATATTMVAAAMVA